MAGLPRPLAYWSRVPRTGLNSKSHSSPSSWVNSKNMPQAASLQPLTVRIKSVWSRRALEAFVKWNDFVGD